MTTKKRKIDSECRVFKDKWEEQYLFLEANVNTASFLICRESIAVKIFKVYWEFIH